MNEDELTLRKLVIQDEEGRNRIVLFTNRHGAGIIHYDANGKRRIHSGTLASGEAMAEHHDANGEARISSATFASGVAKTTHFDANEKMRIGSYTNADGDAWTTWLEYDANGKRQPVKTLP